MAYLLGELVTTAEVPGETKTTADLLGEPVAATDLGESEKIADLLRDLERTADILGEPETTADLLEEPERTVELLGEPERTAELLGELETTADLLGEPETVAELLNKTGAIPDLEELDSLADHLQEPQTTADLPEKSRITAVRLEEPDTTTVLLKDPEISVSLQEGPQTVVILEEDPETTKHQQEEPEAAKNLLVELQITTDKLTELKAVAHLQEKPQTTYLFGEIQALSHFTEPQTSTVSTGEPVTLANLHEESNTQKSISLEADTSLDIVTEQDSLLDPLKVSKMSGDSCGELNAIENTTPGTSATLPDIALSLDPGGLSATPFTLPGLVVRPPTSESEQQDSEDITTATNTSESDDVAADETHGNVSTYVSLQDDIALEFLSSQSVPERISRESQKEVMEKKIEIRIPTLKPSLPTEDLQEEEPELMNIDYSDDPSAESELPVPSFFNSEAALSPLYHQVEELEEHRGSPWLMFTAITDYIRSRSPSPINMFFSENVSQPISTEIDFVPAFDSKDSEQESRNEQRDLSGASDQIAVGNELKYDSQSVRCVQPPSSLPLSHVISTASQDTPQEESSDTLTSLTYETASEHQLGQPSSSTSEHALGGLSLPDLTPEEAPDLPPDLLRRHPTAGLAPLDEPVVLVPTGHTHIDMSGEGKLVETSQIGMTESSESNKRIDASECIAAPAADVTSHDTVSFTIQEETAVDDNTKSFLKEKTFDSLTDSTDILTEGVVDFLKNETTDVDKEETIHLPNEEIIVLVKEKTEITKGEKINQSKEAKACPDKSDMSVLKEDAVCFLKTRNVLEEKGDTTRALEGEIDDSVKDEATDILEEGTADLVKEEVMEEEKNKLFEKTISVQREVIDCLMRGEANDILKEESSSQPCALDEDELLHIDEAGCQTQETRRGTSITAGTPWHSFCQESQEEYSDALDADELIKKITDIHKAMHQSEELLPDVQSDLADGVTAVDTVLDSSSDQKWREMLGSPSLNLLGSKTAAEVSQENEKNFVVSERGIAETWKDMHPSVTITTEPIQESSCESDSDDDMRVGPIKGCRPLIIPLSPSPTKNISSASDSDESQSESDATTDEDEVELPGKKPKSKFTRPAQSHSSKLHTIPELSEDEDEDVVPLRPPRLKRLSLSRLRLSEGRGPDSPKSGGASPKIRSPKIGKMVPEFLKRFEERRDDTSSCLMEREESESPTQGFEDRPRPMQKFTRTQAAEVSSSDSEDEVTHKTMTYGRRTYVVGTLSFSHRKGHEIGESCSDTTNSGKNIEPLENKHRVESDDDSDPETPGSVSDSEGEDQIRKTSEQCLLDINPTGMTNELCDSPEGAMCVTATLDPAEESSSSETNKALHRSEESLPTSSLTLNFLEEEVSQSSFFPPMEVLLIPDQDDPTRRDSPGPSEPLDSVAREQPHRAKYVITALGEESVLTEHAFAPPMETLLIPLPDETVEDDPLETEPDSPTLRGPSPVETTYEENVGRQSISDQNALLADSGSGDHFHQSPSVEFTSEEILEPHFRNPQELDHSSISDILPDATCFKTGSYLAQYQEMKAGTAEIARSDARNGGCFLDTSRGTKDTVEGSVMDTREMRERGVPEIQGHYSSHSGVTHPDCLHGLTDTRTSEDKLSDEDQDCAGKLTKEQLTFFQSGGLQRLASSMEVIDPTKMVLATGEVGGDVSVHSESCAALDVDCSQSKSNVDPLPATSDSPDLSLENPLDLTCVRDSQSSEYQLFTASTQQTSSWERGSGFDHKLGKLQREESFNEELNDVFPAACSTFCVTASSDPFSPFGPEEMCSEGQFIEETVGSTVPSGLVRDAAHVMVGSPSTERFEQQASSADNVKKPDSFIWPLVVPEILTELPTERSDGVAEATVCPPVTKGWTHPLIEISQKLHSDCQDSGESRTANFTEEAEHKTFPAGVPVCGSLQKSLTPAETSFLSDVTNTDSCLPLKCSINERSTAYSTAASCSTIRVLPEENAADSDRERDRIRDVNDASLPVHTESKTQLHFTLRELSWQEALHYTPGQAAQPMLVNHVTEERQEGEKKGVEMSVTDAPNLPQHTQVLNPASVTAEDGSESLQPSPEVIKLGCVELLDLQPGNDAAADLTPPDYPPPPVPDESHSALIDFGDLQFSRSDILVPVTTNYDKHTTSNLVIPEKGKDLDITAVSGRLTHSTSLETLELVQPSSRAENIEPCQIDCVLPKEDAGSDETKGSSNLTGTHTLSGVGSHGIHFPEAIKDGDPLSCRRVGQTTAKLPLAETVAGPEGDTERGEHSDAQDCRGGAEEREGEGVSELPSVSPASAENVLKKEFKLGTDICGCVDNDEPPLLPPIGATGTQQNKDISGSFAEDESDTPMVTAAEEAVSKSSTHRGHHLHRDSTLSEVSSDIFEAARDFCPSTDQQLVQSINTLPHGSAFGDVSNDLETLSVPSEGRATPFEETVITVEEEARFEQESTSSTRTDVVISNFEQMLEAEGSFSSTLTQPNQEESVITPNDSEIRISDLQVRLETTERWVRQACHTCDSPNKLVQKHFACDIDNKSETPTSAESSHRSLLEEIHNFRIPSTSSSTEGETKPKADARYEGGKTFIVSGHHTALVATRKHFWDEIIAGNASINKRQGSSSSESTEVASQGGGESRCTTVCEGRYDDDVFDQVNLHPQEVQQEEAPVGLVQRMKATWSNLITQNSDSATRNNTGESNQPVCLEADTKVSQKESKQFWKSLTESPVQQVGDSGQQHPDRVDQGPLEHQSAVKVQNCVTKTGTPPVSAATEAIIPFTHCSLTLPDCGRDLHKEKDAIKDNKELHELVEVEKVSFSEITVKGVSRVKRDLWENKPNEQEGALTKPKPEGCEAPSVLQNVVSQVNKPLQKGQQTDLSQVMSERLMDLKIMEESQRLMMEHRDGSVGEESCEAWGDIVRRCPSIRMIERGIVRTRAEQWEGELLPLEEDSSLEKAAPPFAQKKEKSRTPAMRSSKRKLIYRKSKRKKGTIKAKKSLNRRQISVRIKDGTVIDMRLLWEAREKTRRENVKKTCTLSGKLVEAAVIAGGIGLDAIYRKAAEGHAAVAGAEEPPVLEAPQSSEDLDDRDVVRHDEPLAEPDIEEGLVQSTKQMWLNLAATDALCGESVLRSRVRAHKNKRQATPRTAEESVANHEMSNRAWVPEQPTTTIPGGAVLLGKEKLEASFRQSNFHQDFQHWKKKRARPEAKLVKKTSLCSGLTPSSVQTLSKKISSVENESNQALHRVASLEDIKAVRVEACRSRWEVEEARQHRLDSSVNEDKISESVFGRDTGQVPESLERSPTFRGIEKGRVQSGRDIWEAKQRAENSYVAAEDLCEVKDSLRSSVKTRMFGASESVIPATEELDQNDNMAEKAADLSREIDESNLYTNTEDAWEAQQEKGVLTSQPACCLLDNNHKNELGQKNTSKEKGYTQEGDESFIIIQGVVREGRKLWEERVTAPDECNAWRRARDMTQDGVRDASLRQDDEGPKESSDQAGKIETFRSDSEKCELSETESAALNDEDLLTTAPETWNEEESVLDLAAAKESGHISAPTEKLKTVKLSSIEAKYGSDTSSLAEPHSTPAPTEKLKDMRFSSVEAEYGSDIGSPSVSLASENEFTATTSKGRSLSETLGIAVWRGAARPAGGDLRKWKLSPKLPSPDDEVMETKEHQQDSLGEEEKQHSNHEDVEKEKVKEEEKVAVWKDDGEVKKEETHIEKGKEELNEIETDEKEIVNKPEEKEKESDVESEKLNYELGECKEVSQEESASYLVNHMPEETDNPDTADINTLTDNFGVGATGSKDMEEALQDPGSRDEERYQVAESRVNPPVQHKSEDFSTVSLPRTVSLQGSKKAFYDTMLSDANASQDDLSCPEKKEEEDDDTPPALPTASPPRVCVSSQPLHMSSLIPDDIISCHQDEHIFVTRDASCLPDTRGISSECSLKEEYQISEPGETASGSCSPSPRHSPDTLTKPPDASWKDKVETYSITTTPQSEPQEMETSVEDEVMEVVAGEAGNGDAGNGSHDCVPSTRLVATKKNYWDKIIAKKNRSEEKRIMKNEALRSDGGVKRTHMQEGESTNDSAVAPWSFPSVAAHVNVFSQTSTNSRLSLAHSPEKKCHITLRHSGTLEQQEQTLVREGKASVEKETPFFSLPEPQSPTPVVENSSSDAGKETTSSVEEGRENRNIVAEKKGFWDDFISQREKNLRKVPFILHKRSAHRKDTRKGLQSGRAKTVAEEQLGGEVFEEMREGTSLGRKLSITIKRGTVRENQTKYEDGDEDQYSKWKRTRAQKQQKFTGKTKLTQSHTPQKNKVSIHTESPNRKIHVTQVNAEMGNINKSSNCKPKATRRARTPVVMSLSERDTSDEDTGPPRVRRRTSVEIQKGLVQKCRSQWETNTCRTGYWTWKRQKVSPSKGMVLQQPPRTLSPAIASERIQVLRSPPSSPKMSFMHAQQRLSPTGSPQRLTPERASVYGHEVGLPVQRGRDFWEQDRSRTPTPPPFEVPQRPLTPDETQQFLSSMRGRVAQQRRRFDSLGSMISSSSAGSLDSPDGVLESRSDRLSVSHSRHDHHSTSSPKGFIPTPLAGKVSRQKDLWESKTKITPEMSSLTSLRAKKQALERRHSAEVLPVAKTEGETEDPGEMEPKELQEEQERRTLLYVLHSTVGGDLLLETYTDTSKNAQWSVADRPMKAQEGRPGKDERCPPQRTRRKKGQTDDSLGSSANLLGGNNYEKGDVPKELRPSCLPSVLPTLSPVAAPVPMTAVDDGYLEYKHSFASTRLQFEAGMRQAELDPAPQDLHNNTLATLKTESENVNMFCETTHQLSPELQTSSTSPMTPPESVVSPEAGFRCEAEVQTDPKREKPLSPEPHFVDHGCQTDEELEYNSGPSGLLDPEQPLHGRVSPARDQEIQVTQDDLVNPLKRIVSQGTRRYDLLEVPHLKRRVFQRRIAHQQRSRSLSSSDVPWQQLWNDEGVPEDWSRPIVGAEWRGPQVGTAWSKQVAAAWNRQMAVAISDAELSAVWDRTQVTEGMFDPEVAEMWVGPDTHDVFPESLEEPYSSGSFGFSDSSPLVASLRALVQDLPSAYPEALPHDDLADLDHNNFSSFPEEEVHSLALRHAPRSRVAAPNSSPVIKTLSGCYTSEFPHLPVPGTGHSYSLHGGRKDLITLKDLRRHPRPNDTVVPPRNSDDLTSKDKASEPSVCSSSHTADPPAHQKKDQLPNEAAELLGTSSGSLGSSATGEAKSSCKEDRDTNERWTLQTPTEQIQEEQQAAVDELHSHSEESRHEETIQEMEENKELEGEVGREEEEESSYIEKGDEENISKAMTEDAEKGEVWCGCRAFGEGLHRGTVHEANTFLIDTSEAELGEVRVSVEGPHEGTVSATEVYQAEGQPTGVYEVFYWVTIPAKYYISITWAGQHLKGSPFMCEVQE